jgi:hypothetical protein
VCLLGTGIPLVVRHSHITQGALAALGRRIAEALQGTIGGGLVIKFEAEPASDRVKLEEQLSAMRWIKPEVIMQHVVRMTHDDAGKGKLRFLDAR